MWPFSKINERYVSPKILDLMADTSYVENVNTVRRVGFAYTVFRPEISESDFALMLDLVPFPVMIDTIHFGFLVLSVNSMPISGGGSIDDIQQILENNTFKANSKSVWGEEDCITGNFGNKTRIAAGFRHPNLPKVFEILSNMSFGESVKYE